MRKKNNAIQTSNLHVINEDMYAFFNIYMQVRRGHSSFISRAQDERKERKRERNISYMVIFACKKNRSFKERQHLKPTYATRSAQMLARREFGVEPRF